MTTIDIYLNNGNKITADMENYQAATLAAALNDHRNLFISIGNTIINRNMIQLVMPVTAEQTA